MNKPRKHDSRKLSRSQGDSTPAPGAGLNKVSLQRVMVGVAGILVVLFAVWAYVRFSNEAKRPGQILSVEKVEFTNRARISSSAESNAAVTKADAEHRTDSTAAELNATANNLLKSGDAAGAVRAYKKALELTPNDEDIHYNLGIAYMRAGDLTNAESEYREALKLLPDYPEVHNNLGNLLLRSGRLKEAEEQFTEAIKQMPEYAQAHNNLGIIRQRQKMTNEALVCFQKAVNLDTNYWEARFNLAMAYLQRHEREKGIEELKEVLRVNPSSEIAQRVLQQALGQPKAPAP